MFKVSTPKIPKKEIVRRYAHIKPVITINGKLHYLRDFSPEELSSPDYMWHRVENVQRKVDENELEVWEGRDFACRHNYGYTGSFFPTIHEILSQIKEADVNVVKAFEVLQLFAGPKVNDYSFMVSNCYYVSIVRLYINKVR